jgi:uncharacterized membrane protein YhiD involved in acid resistance
MGFIGGGAILRQRNAVHGTATAAALWSTVAMGAATGFGLYHIAVLLSVVNFTTLKLLRPLKRQSTEVSPGRPDQSRAQPAQVLGCGSGAPWGANCSAAPLLQ